MKESTTMRDIQMTPVQSSQLAEIGYDKDSKTLAIRFNGRHDEPKGRLYHYSNVEPETFEALQNAESKGSYFLRNIKPNPGQYPYEKIDEAAKDDEAESAQTGAAGAFASSPTGESDIQSAAAHATTDGDVPPEDAPIPGAAAGGIDLNTETPRVHDPVRETDPEAQAETADGALEAAGTTPPSDDADEDASEDNSDEGGGEDADRSNVE
jgi:hypothetical protein